MGWNLSDSTTSLLPNISFLSRAKWLHSTKMWRTVRIHWHRSHRGGGSFLKIYEWVKCVWPMRARHNTTHMPSPTKFKTHYVAPQFYFFAGPSKLCQIFFIEIRTYFSISLILQDITNSITPQTTLRLLLILVELLVLPSTCQCRRSPLTPSTFLFSCLGHRNLRKPVPVTVTGVRYNSLLWMCTLNTWPDLTWPDAFT